MKQFMEAPVRNALLMESCLIEFSFALLSITFKGIIGRTFISSASVGENGGVESESDFGGEVFPGGV